MMRLLVDFNDMYEGEDDAVVLNERYVPAEVLVSGPLYEADLDDDPYMECEAIVRRGKIRPWVGEIVKGTFKYPKD